MYPDGIGSVDSSITAPQKESPSKINLITTPTVNVVDAETMYSSLVKHSFII